MKEMNVISIVNIRASFPPLNSQGVRPLFNLHLKQIQGNVSHARVPEDFRIIFITIFPKASGTPFFLFFSFLFFLLEFIYLIGFEACQKNHKPLPTHDKSLPVQMSLYGQTTYKSDSSVYALRTGLGSESHSLGALISALRAGTDSRLLL